MTKYDYNDQTGRISDNPNKSNQTFDSIAKKGRKARIGKVKNHGRFILTAYGVKKSFADQYHRGHAAFVLAGQRFKTRLDFINALMAQPDGASSFAPERE